MPRWISTYHTPSTEHRTQEIITEEYNITIHKNNLKKKQQNARRANLIKNQTLYASETITTKDEWIRRRIPNLDRRMSRIHSQLNFHLILVFNNLGFFNNYLHPFGEAKDRLCPYLI